MKIALMDTEDPHWKRIWRPPKRGYGNTPQAKYIRQGSYERFIQRQDVETMEFNAKEFGRYESIRLITI